MDVNFYHPYTSPMIVSSRTVGLMVSATMVLISIAIMVFERAITAEAWGLLLLTPIPIAFTLSGKSQTESMQSSSDSDWTDSDVDSHSDGVGNPEDAGFDVPVL